MVPGVTFLYSSGVQAKNRLYIMLITIVAMGISYLQFYAFGYSLAFDGRWGLKVVGGLNKLFLAHLGGLNHNHTGELQLADGNERDWAIGKEYLNFLINLSGVGIATCLIVGGSAERSSTRSILAYVIAWIPIVYCPLVYITVNDDGFMSLAGYFNYTAGTTNLAIGVSALCFSYMLGPREINVHKHDDKDVANRATFSYLGTFLVWFTWFGLVGSGTGGANIRTVIALVNMNIAGAVGGLSHMLVTKYILKENSMNPNVFCTGLIAGLLGISPAAGFVSVKYALLFGFNGSLFCIIGQKIKNKLKIDEPTGVFESHGMASFIGVLLAGIFSTSNISTIEGGPEVHSLISGNYTQPLIHLLACLVAIFWSLLASIAICKVLGSVAWFEFRLNAAQEHKGMDGEELGLHHDVSHEIQAKDVNIVA